MSTRPQALLTPRPNVRRVHPLDAYEQALIDDPPQETDADAPPNVGVALVASLLLWALVVAAIYGLWVALRVVFS